MSFTGQKHLTTKSESFHGLEFGIDPISNVYFWRGFLKTNHSRII